MDGVEHCLGRCAFLIPMSPPYRRPAKRNAGIAPLPTALDRRGISWHLLHLRDANNFPVAYVYFESEQRRTLGPVAELVGIEGGVVSGVFNLESSDVGASDRRPRHEENYHEV